MMTQDESYRLIAEINTAFTPAAPINSRDLFAGRRREVEKAIGTVFQPGQHAVIYGERGVGKTSLANTLFDFLVFMGKHNYQRARLNCAQGMSFEQIWRGIFRQLTTRIDGEDVELDNTLPGDPHSENVREVFQTMDNPSIVIIDEFDRIADNGVETALADTIKTLADNSIDTTLIVVGVADSLNQLIKEHRSIQRAIREIYIRRMSKAELLEIIDKGMGQCKGLSVDPTVRERIADYSQGLPSITHLLAREAALQVVRSLRSYIIMPDLDYVY
jgi:Cdc6-like AAA superfamily ATPase